MDYTHISSEERREIIISSLLSQFEREIRAHVLPIKHMPLAVMIRTEYPDSTARVTIRFDDSEV